MLNSQAIQNPDASWFLCKISNSIYKPCNYQGNHWKPISQQMQNKLWFSHCTYVWQAHQINAVIIWKLKGCDIATWLFLCIQPEITQIVLQWNPSWETPLVRDHPSWKTTFSQTSFYLIMFDIPLVINHPSCQTIFGWFLGGLSWGVLL